MNGVPRIRGDDPAMNAISNQSAQCSPHTRG